jgi:hypothetical protein
MKQAFPVPVLSRVAEAQRSQEWEPQAVAPKSLREAL